jgi:hypothetical protein
MKSELAYANSPGRIVHTAQHTRRGHEKVCAYCHIDFWFIMWYNISVKRKKRGKQNEKDIL